LSIAAFISGIFIDLDHLIDYVIEHGLHFNIKEFFPFFYEEKHSKITLLFHGWEFLIIFATVAWFTDFNPVVTGVLIGYGHHIILDYVYSRTAFLSYSLIWRWKIKFDSKRVFPRNRRYRPYL
jgi:hypothetical protein